MLGFVSYNNNLFYLVENERDKKREIRRRERGKVGREKRKEVLVHDS